MPREAGFYNVDGGLTVFRSAEDQPAEAFDNAFKQHMVGQKPVGFSVENMENMKQTDLLHSARSVLRGARESVTNFLTEGLERATFTKKGGLPGVAKGVVETLNPVPGTVTDVGQLAGTGLGMLAGSLLPGAGTVAGGIIGGGLGRMGGSMLEENPQPFSEGAMGLVTGFAPQALRAGGAAGRTVVARNAEKQVVNDTLGQLQTMLPDNAPGLSKNISIFQKQMSATGNKSLTRWASSEFKHELDQINSAVGEMQVRIPSLGEDPVKIKEVIEAISSKGQRLIAGQEPRTFSQKVNAVGRAKVVEELDFVLRQNGLDAVADGYAQARNNFARTNEVVRLFTNASEAKRPLDLGVGKIDLAKLQRRFLEVREKGGLKPFDNLELEGLENTLGRGTGLAGTDFPMDLPGLISLGIAPGKSTGLRIAAPTLPKAAGVRYKPPTAAERVIIPQLLGQGVTRLQNE